MQLSENISEIIKQQRFRSFFPIRRRITCASVYDALRGTLQEYSKAPKEGWPKFAYRYAKYLSFPGTPMTEEELEKYGRGAKLFLSVLQAMLDEERKSLPFDQFMDFQFLSEEEAAAFESREEYRRFRKYFREDFVYEMLRLNEEVTEYHTLAHLAGVHHVAMFMARHLLDAGIPIDLTIISAAAAAHDLGKFGCREGENVPFLHYYYINQWFKRHRMPFIGHIAANHSTWDLEPENLSVESLVLIYADFRVKESKSASADEGPVVSLDRAFETIRGKLYNLDEKKLYRYRRVYTRLKDFQDYMEMLGIDTTFARSGRKPLRMPEVTLRSGSETLRSLTYMGVEHNILVMHRMTAERQFGNLLEAARSEKDVRNMRIYLDVFDRYSAYTNSQQKKQTLDFLYELLMSSAGDISTEAARLLGKILAQFHFGYRKRLPEGMPDMEDGNIRDLAGEYFDRISRPDYKLTQIQKERIQSHLKHVVAAVVQYAEESDLPQLLEKFLEEVRKCGEKDAAEIFAILDAVQFLPFDRLDPEQNKEIGRFIASSIDAGDEERRTDTLQEAVLIAALRAARFYTEARTDPDIIREIGEKAAKLKTEKDNTMAFLVLRILRNLDADVSAQKNQLYGQDVVSDIFLDNLKSATPWIVKSVNIKLLKDQLTSGVMDHKLHIAAHLSNLIKVSEHAAVRHDAGEALVEILRYLGMDERNEVVVELVRGLETSGREYAKSLSEYLGETALWLEPKELDEIIDYLDGLQASPNVRVAASALDTVGALLCYYSAYRERFGEPEENYTSRQHRLLGILFRGLANYREEVNREAMLMLSVVFSSDGIPDAEKRDLFVTGARKFLFLMEDQEQSGLSVYYRAAVLSAINSFMTEQTLEGRRFRLPQSNRIAFFPGTFDPLTLSHKGIARMIRDAGYEVYLSVDEFSWSKKAQPHLVRSRIVSMSMANEFHVHIFPKTIPINIANPDDLRRLKRLFSGKEIYLVVGNDVLAGASSYRAAPVPDSVHHLNHITFSRKNKAPDPVVREIKKAITGRIVEMELPEELEEISSTMIRENIDMNRDISSMIDPVAQEYIYNSGLYLREPEFKPLASGKVIAFEETQRPEGALLRECRKLAPMQDPGQDTFLLLRNQLEKGKLVGLIRYCYLTPDELFAVLGDVEVADTVRRHTLGEILFIRGLYAGKDSEIKDPEQLLLAEAIAQALARGCSYAIFYPGTDVPSEGTVSAVERQGFIQARRMNESAPLYLVDMHEPLVILKNMRTSIKDPLADSSHIIRVLERSHKELQRALTKLYPGQLVLSVSAATIYPRLVEKVTAVNGVPNKVLTPRQLGPYMCVPYGKILRDRVIPNTVTKTLHTDKVFTPDLSEGKIESFQNYPSLENQIKILKSFRREVILVDDLLHRAGRFEALEPLLQEEGVTIRKVIVGIVSGYGLDTMALKGVDIDSVYRIPNLRGWLVESTLYPFIGGDTVRRESVKVAGLSPSINMIFPYTRPFLKDTSEEALFDFSACCIRNARDIFLALEEVYRAYFGKNLTLGRLSEAVIAPLCPDRGECTGYDPNLAASVYLENDLQMLSRIRGKQS